MHQYQIQNSILKEKILTLTNQVKIKLKVQG